MQMEAVQALPCFTQGRSSPTPGQVQSGHLSQAGPLQMLQSGSAQGGAGTQIKTQKEKGFPHN